MCTGQPALIPHCFHLCAPYFHIHGLSSAFLRSPRRDIISSCTEFLFHFGDWQPRWCLPLICILRHLLPIPAPNGGDSQTAAPELVCSSLGSGAANQKLRWEKKDGFKLHPSQSTGGAHESATSRRFSPSGGSLQIDSDSTPLTSETPTRASPIKSLLWFPLLIINATELSGAVIGMCLWGFLAHEHVCVSSMFPPQCGRKLVWFVLPGPPSMCFSFSCTFTLEFYFMWCLCWWLPHNHDWKAIKRLFGNWRCHIGFQQETRRGVAVLTAEVDAGNSETVSRKDAFYCEHCLSLWLLHKHWSGPRTPG